MKNRVLISIICCLSLANAVDDDYAKNRAGIGSDEKVFETSEVINTRQTEKLDDVQDNTYAVIYNHLQRYEIMKDKESSQIKQATDFSGQISPTGMIDFYAQAQEKQQQAQEEIMEEPTEEVKEEEE